MAFLRRRPRSSQLSLVFKNCDFVTLTQIPVDNSTPAVRDCGQAAFLTRALTPLIRMGCCLSNGNDFTGHFCK